MHSYNLHQLIEDTFAQFGISPNLREFLVEEGVTLFPVDLAVCIRKVERHEFGEVAGYSVFPGRVVVVISWGMRKARGYWLRSQMKSAAGLLSLCCKNHGQTRMAVTLTKNHLALSMHHVGRKSRRFHAGAFRRMHRALAEGAMLFRPTSCAPSTTATFT